MKFQSWMVALALPMMLAGCTGGFGDESDDSERGPIGKADLIGSCTHAVGGDHCGGPSDGNCWCDDLCDDIGDCCEDKAEVCDGASDALCTAADGACTAEAGCPDGTHPAIGPEFIPCDDGGSVCCLPNEDPASDALCTAADGACTAEAGCPDETHPAIGPEFIPCDDGGSVCCLPNA